MWKMMKILLLTQSEGFNLYSESKDDNKNQLSNAYMFFSFFVIRFFFILE